MTTLIHELSGGDRRSIGRSNAVVGKVLRDSSRFAEIIDGLSNDDPLVRMRCADVAEKVSLTHPEWLRPHKRTLLRIAACSIEQQVRWHLAQMLPRLDLNRDERRRTEAIMLGYFNDKSRIVKTFAMQALFDLSVGDPPLRQRVLVLLHDVERTGTPAMRARARRLLQGIPL